MMKLITLMLGITNAAKIEFNSTSKTVQIFSIKESCLALSPDKGIISNALNESSIDCMGEKILATQVCEKQIIPDLKSRKLLRGVVDLKTQDILCELGHDAQVSFWCKGSELSHCKNANETCVKLKSIYAKGLDLKHSAHSGEKVTCLYDDSNIEEDLTKNDLDSF